MLRQSQPASSVQPQSPIQLLEQSPQCVAATNSSFEVEIAALRDQVDRMEQKSDSQDERICGLIQINEELMTLVDNLRQESNIVSEENRELQAVLDRVQQDVLALQEGNHWQTSKMNELQQENSKLGAIVGQLQRENAEMRRESSDLGAVIADLNVRTEKGAPSLRTTELNCTVCEHRMTSYLLP